MKCLWQLTHENRNLPRQIFGVENGILQSINPALASPSRLRELTEGFCQLPETARGNSLDDGFGEE